MFPELKLHCVFICSSDSTKVSAVSEQSINLTHQCALKFCPLVLLLFSIYPRPTFQTKIIQVCMCIYVGADSMCHVLHTLYKSLRLKQKKDHSVSSKCGLYLSLILWLNQDILICNLFGVTILAYPPPHNTKTKVFFSLDKSSYLWS